MLEIDAFKIDVLFYIDIFSVAFGKIRSFNNFLNTQDYVDLGSFTAFELSRNYEATLQFVELVLFVFGRLMFITAESCMYHLKATPTTFLAKMHKSTQMY